MPPGHYTVSLAARGETMTQPLEMLKDPASGGSEDGIRANVELARSIQRDMSDVVQMINTLELTRGRLASLRMVLGADSSKLQERTGVRAAGDSLDQTLERLEEKLFQRRITGRGQDDVRWSPALAEQLEYLARSVGGSDYAPTASQRDVAQLLHERAVGLRSEFNGLMARELPAFNEQLKRAQLDLIGE